MTMLKNRKMILVAISIAIIAFLVSLFIYYQSHKNYVFIYILGDAVLLEKEQLHEDGKQNMVLTISQRHGMDRYVLRVGIDGDQERQDLIYNMLLTNGAYETSEYRFEIPRDVARQYGLSSADVMNIDKILNIPELLTQEYVKLLYLWE